MYWASASCDTPLGRKQLVKCRAVNGQSTDSAGAGTLAIFTCTDAPMTEAYQGSCLCAAVSFELLTRPMAVTHCHCSQCRKGHGAAFASYGSVPRSKLRLLCGANSIKTYASSPKVAREFCVECGSSLFWSSSQGEFADWVSIALGTLDTPFLANKQSHLHLESAAPWHTPSSGESVKVKKP